MVKASAKPPNAIKSACDHLTGCNQPYAKLLRKTPTADHIRPAAAKSQSLVTAGFSFCRKSIGQLSLKRSLPQAGEDMREEGAKSFAQNKMKLKRRFSAESTAQQGTVGNLQDICYDENSAGQDGQPADNCDLGVPHIGVIDAVDRMVGTGPILNG